MNSRYDYIDYAKGFGILLVVWAHILIVGWSHEVIYAFHMPLFFFISGLLFRKERYISLRQFVTVRAKRLIIPYFIYSVVTWAVWAAFRYLRQDNVVSFWKPLLQTVIAQGSGEFMVHNSALWFVPCLFAVEFIYYLFSRVNHQWLTLALCFLIAFAGVVLSRIFGADYLFALPWNLDAAFYALPFYGLANTLMHYTSHSKLLEYCNNNRIIVISVAMILAAVMMWLAFTNGECSMGSSSYNCNMWVFFGRALCGCVSFLMISLWLSTFDKYPRILQWIKWCGANSLDIMCLHIPIKGVVSIAISKILADGMDVSQSALYSTITFIITLLVMVPIIILINKYFRNNPT